MRKKVRWTNTWALQGLPKELNRHVFTRQNRHTIERLSPCNCNHILSTGCETMKIFNKSSLVLAFIFIFPLIKLDIEK